MPGIAGVVMSRKAADGRQLLDAMLSSMMAEPFYSCAEHAFPSQGLFCARVSIDDSYSSLTPAFSRSGDVALFLAGECLSDGSPCPSGAGGDLRPDPALLVSRYEEEGPGFVRRLNGWFSGVILDSKRGKAVVFTDRCGIQRVYFHEEEGLLVFASEAKALLRALPQLKSADPRGIAEYLCFDCVLENRTYWSGVKTIPGGSVWTCGGGVVEKKVYFDPSDLESRQPMNAAAFSDRLAETFVSVMPRYLSGKRLAMALTGGQDTRLIMACIPEDRHDYGTLTFGGMYKDSLDVRLARKVARACGVPHEVVRLGPEFLCEYSRHALRAIYLSDGMADATNLDSIYLDSLVRNIASIKLMGTFGSQVMGRVRRALRFRPPDPALVAEGFAPLIHASKDSLSRFEGERDLTFVLKHEIPWYWSRFTVPQLSQLTIRSPFLDNDVIDLLYQAPPDGFDGSRFELAAITRWKPALMDIPTNKGERRKNIPVIGSIVRGYLKGVRTMDKVLNWDIMPHALHHKVARVDSLLLSPLRLNRLFLGFEYFRHYALWFRRELAGYLERTLLDDRTLSRPYWNPDFIRAMVRDHISGRRRYLSEIRKVLTMELIHRTLMEGDAE